MDKTLEQNREKVIVFLRENTDGPAFEHSLAETARRLILPGTDIASWIIENPLVLSSLPPLIENAMRENLKAHLPEKSSEKPPPHYNQIDLEPFSTNDKLIKICEWMNDIYNSEELYEKINELISNNHWEKFKQAHDSIGKSVLENIIEAAKSARFNISSLDGTINNLEKGRFYYTQKDGPEIIVYLNNEGKTYWAKIYYLLNVDCLPVIAEMLFAYPAEVVSKLSVQYFPRKQQAVKDLCDGKMPGLLLIFPDYTYNDKKYYHAVHASRDPFIERSKNQLERYKELGAQIVYLGISYDKVREQFKLLSQ